MKFIRIIHKDGTFTDLYEGTFHYDLYHVKKALIEAVNLILDKINNQIVRFIEYIERKYFK